MLLAKFCLVYNGLKTALVKRSRLSLLFFLSENVESPSTPENTRINLLHSFIPPFEGVTHTDTLIIVSLVLIQIYCIGFHGIGGFLANLTFLPLLLTSISCSIVVIWTWILTLKMYLTKERHSIKFRTE